ncbi:hypothetical protein Q3O98_11345 [Ralstonia pseudosolanacearum]|uniref:hypothetical protein n=1 Tax=Ralstonia pseudosolanacearum TaxID=1310165 RepID=UPI002675E57A|nr:hypothetical protein [Ralstonia pseudosolanacearum]MDO3617329.1 hypothetical protein [Ralstonia pseudosolanacearum]MDO3621693.1 hypothetical protein [Ralstonia pseudosolanacearum]
MKLYENVIIGNFLYGLGFAVRANRPSSTTVGVVNLLQQTPADKLLGDLLLTFPGAVRLIEFKAEDNPSGKERGRHRMLSAAVADDAVMQATSRRVHWYVETAPSEEHGVIARIVPYLDAFPQEKAKRDLLPTYIEQLARELTEECADHQRVQDKAYLELVRLTQGNGEVGTGGLVFVADADGALHYAQLLDIMELRLEHGAWIELHEQRSERELGYQRDLTLQRERGNEVTYSGPSRGMGR